MRDKVKSERGTILDLVPSKKKILYRRELSLLPFYKDIEHDLKFSLRAKGGDYVPINDQVGFDTLSEIVKFIVVDSGGKYCNNKFSYNNDALPEEINEIEHELVVGTKKHIVVNAYERNLDARKKCLEFHGTSCKVCGFSFGSKYGELANGFIHIHHLVALS